MASIWGSAQRARARWEAELTRDMLRSRRPRDVRSQSVRGRQSSREALRLRVLNERDYPTDVVRPTTRGDCQGGVRPCPWVSCRWHLYLDVSRRGSLKLNFPDLEPWELEESCALDVADRGASVLNEVGALVNLTREGVHRIEIAARDALKPQVSRELVETDSDRAGNSELVEGLQADVDALRAHDPEWGAA